MNTIDENEVVKNVKKATTHFINTELTIGDHVFTPRTGLVVNNKAGDSQLKLLDYLADNTSTETLKVRLTSVSIGNTFVSEEVIDPALDNLIGAIDAEADTALLDDKPKYEPALFWINVEVTSTHLEEPDGSEGIIRTGGISIDKNAPRAFLSAMLRVINEEDDLDVKMTSVQHVKPVIKTTLKSLDFL